MSAMSTDGPQITFVSSDSAVRLWDVASGEFMRRPSPGHDGIVFLVAASADGCRVVSGSEDGTVRLWDTASGDHGAVQRKGMKAGCMQRR
jgi:WD40 repeat protein